MNAEQEKTEMIRCITAHQLWEQYRVASPPGDIYQPTRGWWLLVTSLDDTLPVSPTTLLRCLESLCTVVETEDRPSADPLLPSCRHLPRNILESTLASTNSNHFLPTRRDTHPGPANLHPRKTDNGAQSTLHSARLVLHQHGRQTLA